MTERRSQDRPSGPWELRAVGGLELLVCPAIEAAGIDAAVTSRRGGVSRGPYRSLNLGLHVGDAPAAVLENRRRVAAAFGADPADLVLGAQVHGADVAVVTERDRGRGAAALDDVLAGVDALVTDRPGPVLTTLVADCAPVVLADPAAGVVATAHAGWRGTVAGVVGAAVRAMVELGAQPGRVVAAVGPTVSARTYQVGDEVAQAVRDSLGEASGTVLCPDGPGHWLLDVAGAVLAQLEAVGVRREAVHMAATTTGAGGPFFSDRQARPCGRFALLARLRR